MPKLTTEEIAEIRNALTIIWWNAKPIQGYIKQKDRLGTIVNQVKRIDKLLPNKGKESQ